MKQTYKVGDIVQTFIGGLVIVGVVKEPPDENGYFSTWQVSMAAHDGRLMSFSDANRHDSDSSTVRLQRESALPSAPDLDAVEAERVLAERTRTGVAAATEAVDRVLGEGL